MKNILNLKNMTQIEVQQAIEYLDVLLELHNKIGHRPISFSESAVEECSKGVEYYIYSVLEDLVKTKEHNWLEEYEHVTRSSSHLRPYYLENLYWYGAITSYKNSLEMYIKYCIVAINTLKTFNKGLKEYKGGNEKEFISIQRDFIIKSLELEAVLKGDTDYVYKIIRAVKDVSDIVELEASGSSLPDSVESLLKDVRSRYQAYIYLESFDEEEVSNE